MALANIQNTQPKGLPGRLSKGAGTHLASWLQESPSFTPSECQSLLDSSESKASNSVKGARALEKLYETHGRKAGHSKAITDVAYSGDILVTKDAGGMRLWRASGDCALLRCVAAKGLHVAVHHTGQFIVTGTRGKVPGVDEGYRNKCWGPSGGSAFSAGKKCIAVKGVRGSEEGGARAAIGRQGSSGLKDFMKKQRRKMAEGDGTGHRRSVRCRSENYIAQSSATLSTVT